MVRELFYFAFNFLTLLAFFAVMNLIMVFLIRKNVRWMFVVGAGLAFCILVAGGLVYGVKAATGHNILDYVNAELNRSLDRAVELEKNRGAGPEELKVLRNRMEFFAVKTFPSWVIVSALFMVFLNYYVVRLFTMKRYGVVNELPPFQLWYVSEKAVWALIAGMAVMLPYLGMPEQVKLAGINVVFFMGNLYFMAGLAIATFYMRRMHMSGFAQFLVYMALFIWTSASLVIVLVGIFDTWFNFRKINKG